MYFIGPNLSHNYSACLVKDGEIKCAIAIDSLPSKKCASETRF